MIIQYADKRYGLEVKSFTDDSDFREALKQAARYGKSLGLGYIHLVVLVEYIPDEYRGKYETDYIDTETGVKVLPVFAETGA
ncbi:MAG: hypothetical protein GY859_13945 [Desulfobacterales bacterium]|nr:hypothetical protein [Desulfobacterales bacterium]